MKQNIKISISSPTKESEAGRLLFTAYKIATHQYQNHSFLLLPTLAHNPPVQTVYFPNLPYSQIHDFWKRVRNTVKPVTPVVAPQTLVQELSLILPEPVTSEDYRDPNSRLISSCDSFLNDCHLVIPELIVNLHTIKVILTRYGTTKSFSLISPKNHTLNLYLRNDQPIDTLLEGIISGVTRYFLQQHFHYSWQETEVAKDTLLTTTILKSHLPKYHSLLMQTRITPNPELVKQSTQYLNSLGFGSDSSWQISSSGIYFNKQPIKDLTYKEATLLTVLINNFPNPVSTEQLSEKLYPNADSYSAWGLSKIVQRLRDKLTKNNLPAHLISSARNQGYVLSNHYSSSSDRDF